MLIHHILWTICIKIQIYYVIQKKFIFKKKISLGQNMRKIMMVLKRKCLEDINVKMYWNEKNLCKFLQFKYCFNSFYKLCVDFEKPSKMKFK
jgi:hypothetical protein